MSDMNMYNSICKHEFDSIKSDVAEVHKDITLIKTKVYNGYGQSITAIEEKVDELEKQINKRMNTVESRLWGVFIGIFMILLAQLVPQFIPDKVVRDPVVIVRGLRYADHG